MSTAKHTAGPWHYLDIGEVVPSDADGFPHEELHICLMATASSDPAAPERIKANARLIAAAPDLLAVVAAFLAVFDPAALCETDLADSRYAEVARLAFEARAKATGAQS